jgi:hypothetical protein
MGGEGAGSAGRSIAADHNPILMGGLRQEDRTKNVKNFISEKMYNQKKSEEKCIEDSASQFRVNKKVDYDFAALCVSPSP